MRALLLGILLLAGCAAPADAPAPTPGEPAAREPPAGEWVTHAPDPRPRYEIAWALVGHELYEIGGLTAGAVATPLVSVYDVGNDTWRDAPPLPMPTHHAAAAVVDDSIYLFGGWVGIGQASLDTAWKLDRGALAWTPIARMPGERGAPAAVALDGLIYIVGGTTIDGMAEEVFVYDPASDSYATAAALPQPADHLALTVHEGKIYAIGGRERSLESSTGLVYAYDVANDTWTERSSMPTPRGGFAAVSYQSHVVAVGGEQAGDPRLLDVVEAYDPEEDAWTTMPALLRPRTGLGAVVALDRIFVLSGASPQGAPGSDAPESFGVA